mmetsp:Transcript_25741/g.41456  ORF Transcript_25741/g.41456 Transcript_25741/m.41456 type:complete len:245 (-) Transcript_25741:294-1028(-)
MRPLSEDETKIFFEKLSTYIGRNIKHLIDRPDEEYCFRLHKERVYYLSQALARRAAHAERAKLVHMGTCFGKFTKSLKFRLHVTCLDYLAQFAKYKVWVKPSSELSYLYGNNVLKAGLGRITENTPQYQGVVVYSMADVPLGFGVTARSTQDCRKVPATDVVVFHQSDVGEYLREEDTNFTGVAATGESAADNELIRTKTKKKKVQQQAPGGGGTKGAGAKGANTEGKRPPAAAGGDKKRAKRA